MFNTVKKDETALVGKRTIVNLDGIWQIGDSIGEECTGVDFDHTAPIPGFLTEAEPAFDELGKYQSRMRQACKDNWRLCTGGVVDMPNDEEAKKAEYGVSHQERNYFWCKRSFKAPAKRSYAILKVLKARFGSKVWVNGKEAGENHSSFISAEYDITDYINWDAENELLIRIGAHPAVAPSGIIDMEDCERENWYPGIWDSVELYCFDSLYISSVQYDTKIAPKKITIETELTNKSDAEVTARLTNIVKTKDMSADVASGAQLVTVGAGEVKTFITEIALPDDAPLWTPETPNLFVLETSVDGDSVLNRFGIREVYFRTATKRFYLNGEVYFLRGGQIMFGRFIEDPLRKQHPWEEAWVRKLLGDTKRFMSWNIAKLSICDIPRRWMEICDEEGVMLVPELPIWCFNPLKPEAFNGYKKEYNLDLMAVDIKNWIRDLRPYTAVTYYSTALESCADWMTEVIIPTGRANDMQKRAWSASYCPPVDPDDPVEDHPYEFTTNGLPEEWHVPGFDMLNLEGKCGHDRQSGIGTPSVPSGHAQVISEYGWLWLTRNGEPSCYLANTYHKLPYPTDTPMERQEVANYLLAGLTEYWRSFRNYSQIVFHSWLCEDIGPGLCATCDYFADVEKLELQPAFIKYVREAFKPLGVYLEFWKREVQAGEERIFYVNTINDYSDAKKGEVEVVFEYEDGTVISMGKKPFAMTANGSYSVKYIVNIPEKLGKTTMKAIATTEDGLTTTSYRWVEVKAEIPPRPYGQW